MRLRRIVPALAVVGVVMAGLTGCLGTSIPSEPSSTPSAAAASPTPTPTPTPETIVDGGPREMANGTVTPNPDGSLTYTVVEGDVGGVICDRFGISGRQLQNEDGRGGISCYTVIDIGDLLNLSKDRPGEGER